ncbi:L-histidine N(alpha)-methyltransferase [Streptomyces sp. NPDC004237]|uniref:L-histidine N(alpha)-methyltransferase n=1 Tax=Streptomyces sp. NPDC004237 TaxID=3154455 RepID=UPI0033B61AA5
MTLPARTAATSHPPAYLPALRADVVRGLTAVPKTLPPKWFYDEAGSRLFEQISRLPEYFPTRLERALITQSSADIAANTRARSLIELGSGVSEKAYPLLDALAETVTAYVPIDVSSDALDTASPAVAAAYPKVAVQPRVADFTAPLDLDDVDGPRLVMLLGGTIGNLLPPERTEFLSALAARLAPHDRLLIGVHLVADPRVIVPAYNDSAGTTALFNAGILHRINRELGADFDVDAFEHVAYWDAENEWIEMRLRSRRAQTVNLRDPGVVVRFAAGEDLLTEVSAKFRPEGLAREVDAAGLELHMFWSDPEDLVGLALIAPALHSSPAA